MSEWPKCPQRIVSVMSTTRRPYAPTGVTGPDDDMYVGDLDCEHLRHVLPS